MAVIAGAAFIAAALSPLLPIRHSNDHPMIAGRAIVIDGDTIDIDGQRIRLWGIDAPEGSQTCSREGRPYPCGREAALALTAFIGSSRVKCVPRGEADRYRRFIAVCSVRDVDLGGWLVGEGWALDYPRYSQGAYATDQARAAQLARGLHSGEFEAPWLHRRSTSSR